MVLFGPCCYCGNKLLLFVICSGVSSMFCHIVWLWLLLLFIDSFIDLFVPYLTLITVPSKTYSTSYPTYYGEYRQKKENYLWQNDHFFCRQQLQKRKTHCVLDWKILLNIGKATICIRMLLYVYILLVLSLLSSLLLLLLSLSS